jgi:hypothetical protein
MAKICELDEQGWREWLAGRPPAVRALAEKYPPDRLYRMADTGHRVTLLAYAEDGTVRVAVTGRFNLVSFERQVFGVDPATLVECDLPGPDEPLGSMDMDPHEAMEMVTRFEDVPRREPN